MQSYDFRSISARHLQFLMHVSFDKWKKFLKGIPLLKYQKGNVKKN